MENEQKISKIINIKCEKTNDFTIIYSQGENNIIEKRAKDLAKNTEELKCFSTENIRTICTYAVLDICSPKFKITDSCIDSESLCFEIFEIITGKKIKMTPKEIFENKKLLRSLSPEDAFLVGYMVNESENK